MIRRPIPARIEAKRSSARQARLAHYLARQERDRLFADINRTRQKAEAFKGAPAQATPDLEVPDLQTLVVQMG